MRKPTTPAPGRDTRAAIQKELDGAVAEKEVFRVRLSSAEAARDEARARVVRLEGELKTRAAENEAALNKASDGCAASIRGHVETIGKLQERLAERETQLARHKDKGRTERAAHDETKGELMDALLQIERLRGYLNALQDLRPPRMVEEDRTPLGAERSTSYATMRRYSDPPARPFFVRGA